MKDMESFEEFREELISSSFREPDYDSTKNIIFYRIAKLPEGRVKRKVRRTTLLAAIIIIALASFPIYAATSYLLNHSAELKNEKGETVVKIKNDPKEHALSEAAYQDKRRERESVRKEHEALIEQLKLEIPEGMVGGVIIPLPEKGEKEFYSEWFVEDRFKQIKSPGEFQALIAKQNEMPFVLPEKMPGDFKFMDAHVAFAIDDFPQQLLFNEARRWNKEYMLWTGKIHDEIENVRCFFSRYYNGKYETVSISTTVDDVGTYNTEDKIETVEIEQSGRKLIKSVNTDQSSYLFTISVNGVDFIYQIVASGSISDDAILGMVGSIISQVEANEADYMVEGGGDSPIDGIRKYVGDVKFDFVTDIQTEYIVNAEYLSDGCLKEIQTINNTCEELLIRKYQALLGNNLRIGYNFVAPLTKTGGKGAYYIVKLANSDLFEKQADFTGRLAEAGFPMIIPEYALKDYGFSGASIMSKYNGGGSFTDMCETADSKGIASWDAYKDNNSIMRARAKFSNATNNSAVFLGMSSEPEYYDWMKKEALSYNGKEIQVLQKDSSIMYLSDISIGDMKYYCQIIFDGGVGSADMAKILDAVLKQAQSLAAE
ncbi:MAG: hypothetical protein ABFD25_20445 [Clostridiaceae bacterium]